MSEQRDGDVSLEPTPIEPEKVKETKQKEVTPFVIKDILLEGDTLLTKPVEFDYKAYKMTSNILIRPSTGHYYTFNTYTYPDGTVSLGPKGTIGLKYPLKHHRITHNFNGKSKQLIGKFTPEEFIEKKLKQGYVK